MGQIRSGKIYLLVLETAIGVVLKAVSNVLLGRDCSGVLAGAADVLLELACGEDSLSEGIFTAASSTGFSATKS